MKIPIWLKFILEKRLNGGKDFVATRGYVSAEERQVFRNMETELAHSVA